MNRSRRWTAERKPNLRSNARALSFVLIHSSLLDCRKKAKAPSDEMTGSLPFGRASALGAVRLFAVPSDKAIRSLADSEIDGTLPRVRA